MRNQLPSKWRERMKPAAKEHKEEDERVKLENMRAKLGAVNVARFFFLLGRQEKVGPGE